MKGNNTRNYTEYFTSFTQNSHKFFVNTDGQLAGYLSKQFIPIGHQNQSFSGKTEIRMNRNSKKIKKIKK